MSRSFLSCNVAIALFIVNSAAFAVDVHRLPTGTSISFNRDIEVPAQADEVMLFERERELPYDRTRYFSCELNVEPSGNARVIRAGAKFSVVSGDWGENQKNSQAVLYLKRASSEGVGLSILVYDTGDEDNETDFGVNLWSRRCDFVFEAPQAVDF